MNMLHLPLFFTLVVTIIAHPDYQTIPLRYDAALDHLRQYQRTDFRSLLNEGPKYSITPEKISSYLLSISDNQTSACEADFVQFFHALAAEETWAFKVADAWGKPLPSGILKGNFYWVGDYDECLQLMYTPANKTFVHQPFQTQYCTLFMPTTGASSAAGSSSLTLGLCVPSSCKRDDVVSLIDEFFQKSNLSDSNMVCSNDPANGQKSLTTGAIVTISILAILALVVLLGTLVDVVLMFKERKMRQDLMEINGSEYHHNVIKTEFTSLHIPRDSQASTQDLIDTPSPRAVFLAEFSALKNLHRIFTVDQKNNRDSYPFLNGIRVLSLFWVIIGHSFLFGILYTKNPLDFIRWSRSVGIQFISSAEFSVDTFFVLSGFLTTILFVRHIEKEKQLSLRTMFLYYLHRYIRLTPTFLLVVAISINLTPYFGSGPLYPTQQGFETPQCRTKYWWTSIVYLGNVIKSDYSCVPVSWYLHNDMQFHWIAPLCLIPFVIKRKPIAFVMCIVFILVGIGSIACLLIRFPDLQASNNILAPATSGRTFFNTIYVAPWCRISAYFVGVLTGFFALNTGRAYRMKKGIFILGNFIAILFVLICIFALYPDNILVPGVARVPFIIYQSLSRTIWALSMGWLLFLCMINRAGIVNRILSWSIWVPLARLNYGTYLTHLMIIYISILNQRMPFYYQLHLVVNNFAAHIFFSYVTSILVVLFIETPFFLLEKRIFKR